MTKAYKTVKVEDGKYFSSFAEGRWKLQYKIGEITRPRLLKSKVFLYDNPENADYFKERRTDVILVGEAENMVCIRGTSLDLETKFFSRIWKTGKVAHEDRVCPDKFFWADSFTPDHVYVEGEENE